MTKREFRYVRGVSWSLDGQVRARVRGQGWATIPAGTLGSGTIHQLTITAIDFDATTAKGLVVFRRNAITIVHPPQKDNP